MLPRARFDLKESRRMPAPPRRWLTSLVCAAASLTLAGLSAAPVAAATDARSAAGRAGGGGSALKNPASGLCLADPGETSGGGTTAPVASCAPGDPGQVWRVP